MPRHDEVNRIECPNCSAGDMRATALLGQWLCLACGLRTNRLTLTSTDQPLTLADVTVDVTSGMLMPGTPVEMQAVLDSAGVKNSPSYVWADFSFGPSVSTVHYRCGRCQTMFTGENTSDVDVQLAAHQRGCFITGDWVRWENLCAIDNWVEGQVTQIEHYISIRIEREGRGRTTRGGTQEFGLGTDVALRRIPRPGQVEVERQHEAAVKYLATPTPMASNADIRDHLKGLGWNVAWNDDPSPTLYDGLTAEQCLEAWLLVQRDERWEGVNVHGDTVSLRYPRLSASQLEAARELWSQQLRAKLAASKERERVQVELEDDAWMANCRDAE